jgi:hypothetical protein
MANSKSIIESLLFEAQSYNNFEDLEKLLDSGADLSSIPIQPLYLSIRNSSSDVIAKALPKMSKQQRQSLVDLDLWEKDTLDLYNFYRWPEIYNLCADIDIKTEFAKSTDFLLFVKSRLNAWTFDTEDPQYPDHDYYFLTEDNLLLIEYDKDFPLIDEVKNLIKVLYSDLGVEKAYSLLFKILIESQMIFQEECYQEKISRLRDYGFVDYFDSLELRSSLISYKQIKNFILKKSPITPGLDTTQKMQALHSTAVKAYMGKLSTINNEISKLKDSKREEYLRFNFIRIVNASISLSNSLKRGVMAISRTGHSTHQKIELGFSYTYNLLNNENTLPEAGVFSLFDFSDLYKIGHSLIELVQKKLKKTLVRNEFDSSSNSFLGETWERFLDDSLSDVIKLKFSDKAEGIIEAQQFEQWKVKSNLLCSLIPFIVQFREVLFDLTKNAQVNDSFYLNYNVGDLDFEPLIISAFINFCNNPNSNEKRLGVKIENFLSFVNNHFSDDLSLIEDKNLIDEIKEFSSKYGFNDIEFFNQFLLDILNSNFSGISFDKLEDDEFKHIGGVLLFSHKV